MPPNPIEIQAVTKQYQTVTAVESLSMTVRQNEVFGLVGPNGAGKSTIIDILVGYKRPTTGSVSVFGTDPSVNGTAVRQRVGVLPDSVALYPEWSGWKHVTFVAHARDSCTDPQQILQRVNLESAASRPVKEYSTGMRQRLLLGMALVDQPELLILDEPSSGVDPEGMDRIRTIVREEQDRGATVLFSSHRLEHVEAVCDRVGIIQQGRLHTVDTVDTVLGSTDQYDTIVTAVDRPSTVDKDRILAVEGVTEVEVRESTVEITCSSRAKKPSLDAVEASGVTITDITTADQTLEDAYLSLATETEQ